MAASTRETLEMRNGSKQVADNTPGPSWREFQFQRKSQLAKHSYYEKVLELTWRNRGAILLDVGCFSRLELKSHVEYEIDVVHLFRGTAGTDLRKVVDDGWPAYQAIGIDLKQAWIDLGFWQYADRDENQITFAVGDILDPSSSWTRQAGTVVGLASWNKPLRCISAFSFFHLFDEENQLKLAGRLASMLVRAPGSVILGAHRMTPTAVRCENSKVGSIFCHSPDSWRSLWQETIFPSELGSPTVRVDIKFVNENAGGDSDKLMEWSVVMV